MVRLFFFSLRCHEWLVHTGKTFLSHIILRLIHIRAERDYKGGKALTQNTVAYIELVLEGILIISPKS